MSTISESTTPGKAKINFAAIPPELAEKPQWVVWKSIVRAAGAKPTKVPFRPDGRTAKSTDASTWTTFSAAVAAYDAGSFSGIGFVFADGGNICGIDLDDCISDAGAMLPWGAAIMSHFPGTYAEISPSGKGVKLWVRGALPGAGRKRGDIEAYDRGRYFTITGAKLPDAPSSIVSAQDAINWLYATHLTAPSAKQQPSASGSDFFDGGDEKPDAEARCRAYLLKCPDAISGAGGHDATLHAACEILRFGLSGETAWRMLNWFNAAKCQPPWSDAELRHKLASAEPKVPFAERGERMRQDRRTPPPKAQSQQTQSTGDGDEDRATELANAEEVYRRHGENIRWHVDRGEWMTWTGTHWQADRAGEVNQFAKAVARETKDRLAGKIDAKAIIRHAARMESAAGVAGVLTLLRTETGISVGADALDRDDYLLNCSNGTLDLRTGELRRHDRADLITRCLATPYMPDAACPLWESVVDRSFAGSANLVAYLQRWCGLFLTGSPNVHELLIAHGVGANGKSVVFDTIAGLLEDYAGVAPESLLIARTMGNEHPTEIASLLGKRLVVASETESGATLRIQLVKRLTGDATITARYMRQDYFEFRRTHKLVLVTNHRPRLAEDTEAVWRRLRLLPFGVVIPTNERDPLLLEKLKAEYPGVLAWMVRGCADWQAGGMRPPPEVLVATADYRAEADELAEFIGARCIVGDPETFRVSRVDLHGAYLAWVKATSERHPLERAQLYESIRRREGISEDRWKVDGQAVRGFRGIGLAENRRENEQW